MKIKLRGEGHSFSVTIPTGLIFSKASVWLYLKLARKYTSTAAKYIPENSEKMADSLLNNLPEEAVYAICEELRRIKKKHGSWELVHVESANGELVNVIL